VANSVERIASARANAVSSRPTAATPSRQSGWVTNAVPHSTTAAITAAQPRDRGPPPPPSAHPDQPDDTPAYSTKTALGAADGSQSRSAVHTQHGCSARLVLPSLTSLPDPRWADPAARSGADCATVPALHRLGTDPRSPAVLSRTRARGRPRDRHHAHACRPEHRRRTTVLNPRAFLFVFRNTTNHEAPGQGQATNCVTRPLPCFITKPTKGTVPGEQGGEDC
jgi:hypothetical protein